MSFDFFKEIDKNNNSIFVEYHRNYVMELRKKKRHNSYLNKARSITLWSQGFMKQYKRDIWNNSSASL